MPKPNYGFQKRQKELAKQQKRAEKLERRQNRSPSDSDDPPEAIPELTDSPQN